MTENANTPPQTTAAKKTAATAAKKTAAKKTLSPGATTPAPQKPRTNASPYLPTLPDGFVYESVSIVGEDGSRLTITAEEKVVWLAIESDATTGKADFPDMGAATRQAAKTARAISDLTKREAEAKRVREESLGLFSTK